MENDEPSHNGEREAVLTPIHQRRAGIRAFLAHGADQNCCWFVPLI